MCITAYNTKQIGIQDSKKQIKNNRNDYTNEKQDILYTKKYKTSKLCRFPSTFKSIKTNK